MPGQTLIRYSGGSCLAWHLVNVAAILKDTHYESSVSYTHLDVYKRQAYVLAMVTLITDEALFSAYGNNEFVETINRYNRKLYTDPLTGVYNRRYYEEQLSGLSKEFSIAMLDVDDFKNINDTYRCV